MYIYEYQAKKILQRYNIPVPDGIIISDKQEIEDLFESLNYEIYVVKAQILAGGRGKAGGIKIVNTKDKAKKIAYKMLNTSLVTNQTAFESHKVKQVYIERGYDIIKECYYSCSIDFTKNCIMFLVSNKGGVDIELTAENCPQEIVKIEVDPILGIQPFHCRRIIDSLCLNNELATRMKEIILSTYKMFIEKDMMTVEINPFVITKDSYLLALDAKITFDDNSLFRQPDIKLMLDNNIKDSIEAKASDLGFSYIKLNGVVGCIANGAGLAMATMDVIRIYGLSAANFLDIGGKVNKERVIQAIKLVLSNLQVKGILINIFGGIVSCEIIAKGIIEVVKYDNITVPIVVRLEGYNSDLGRKLLLEYDIMLASNITEASKILSSLIL